MREYPPFTVSDRCRKAREIAGLEQQELADRIEVSRGTISNYETAAVAPRRIVLRAWAFACGVDFDWLAFGTGSTSQYPDTPTDLLVCVP